ncbi:MAG: midcut-by-XrtH protein [bacterium]
MIIFKKSWYLKGIASALLLGANSLVMAGSGGNIVYRPLPNDVPILGGAGLMILAGLLGLMGYRIFKNREQSGTAWLVGAVAVAAAVSAGSGVKLISDAYAGPNYVMKNNAGGTIYLTSAPGCYQIGNSTDVVQRVEQINPANGYDLTSCANGGGNGGGNGGSFQGTCSDDPATVLDSGDTCEIRVVDLLAR